MVLDENLRPLHRLTERGEDAWHEYLQEKADEILFKSYHPFRWFLHQTGLRKLSREEIIEGSIR